MTTDEPLGTEHAWRTSHEFDGGPRPGLIHGSTTQYANTNEGWEAWASRFRGSTRESLLEDIDAMQDRARAVARDHPIGRQHGCTSTRDPVHVVKEGDPPLRRDGETVFEETRQLGALAEKGTPLSFAWQLENELDALLANIADFEHRCNEEQLRGAFYWAIGRALSVARRLELLMVATHEREILRGADGNFDHEDRTTRERQTAVARFHELCGPSPTPAMRGNVARQVATEYGMKRPTIYRWIKKFPL